MTDINPSNYNGASIVLVGYVSAPASPPAYDKDGSKGVLELRIPINEGYTKDGEFVKTGTTWYAYSAAGDYAAKLREFAKGDKVRIEDAKQEVREYQSGGETKLGITLKFGTITLLESAASKNGATSAATGGFVPDSATGGF